MTELDKAFKLPYMDYMAWCHEYVARAAKKNKLLGYLVADGISFLEVLWAKRYYEHHAASQTIDPWDIPVNFEGCACGSGEYRGTRWHSHCHRASPQLSIEFDVGSGKFYGGYEDCGCSYAGVHYQGDRRVAEALAERIRTQYRCDCEILPVKFIIYEGEIQREFRADQPSSQSL